MSDAPFDLAARFLERSRYYLGVEYPAKIRLAISAMDEGQVWWRPNESSNSAGNLVLHLAGNVRQWVVSGIGGQRDVRQRNAEFAAREGMNVAGLLEHLEGTLAEVDGVLASLSPAGLGEPRQIQGRSTTVFAAIYHVVEHFSTHTGQIVYLAKLHAPGAIQFYEDGDGLATATFLGRGRADID